MKLSTVKTLILLDFFSFIAVITMILYVILYLFPFLQANLYKSTPVVAESQMVCLPQL